MSANIKFNWIFKLGSLSMFSLVAIGARYGHKGKLDETGTAYLNKAQIYHLVNSKHTLTIRFWTLLFLSGRTCLSALQDCSWRLHRRKSYLCGPFVLHGNRRQELVYHQDNALRRRLHACQLACPHLRMIAYLF